MENIYYLLQTRCMSVAEYITFYNDDCYLKSSEQILSLFFHTQNNVFKTKEKVKVYNSASFHKRKEKNFKATIN